MSASGARSPRLVAAVVAVLGLLFAAGCAAPSFGGDEAPAGGPNGPGAAPMPADGDAPRAPTLPGERKLARSATVLLEVGDMERAAAELRRLALVVGGMVTSEVISLPSDALPREYDTSHLVLTVPSDRLDETLTMIAGLGEVRSRTIESVDVTDAVVDVESRVKTMRESIARLQELMKRAGSVGDIAQVESELTQRQAELEALLAQQASLEQRVSTSPITVTLQTAGTLVTDGPGGFLSGLVAGWEALVASGVVALTIVGALLPWLAVAAVVGVPLLIWRRRRAGRPGAEPTASSALLPSAPPAAGPTDLHGDSGAQPPRE